MNNIWRRTPLVTAFAFASLVWAVYALTAGDPVFGSSPAQSAILAIAVAASAVLAIMVAGTIILEINAAVSDSRATGLQRVLVYALLTFAATFTALRFLGFRLDTVLTTSAIVTAVVGFAMQATLSSVIAGLSLHADRALHVGDSFILDGEPVEIVSLNWRSVSGRRINGRIVVIPNAKVADAPCEILKKGESHRTELFFRAPLDQPPQIIADLAREVIADLHLVDRERPIVVTPVEFEPQFGDMRVRAQYWVRNYADRSVVEGEAIKRIWYVLQRHRLYFQRMADLEEHLRAGEDVPRALGQWFGDAMSADDLAALAQKTRVLLFAPDERIVLPSWSEGWQFRLLRGAARATSALGSSAGAGDHAVARRLDQLGPTTALSLMSDALAHRIGPYAKFAVAAASTTSADYAAICRVVAAEIKDDPARAAFLHEVLPQKQSTVEAGARLNARRDAMGVFAVEPPLRAHGETVVLALPPDSEPMAHLESVPVQAALSA
jgi:small-conductance mechanosensitive channel